MKKTFNIKMGILQTTLIMTIFLAILSCNRKSPDTKEVAEKNNELKFDNNKQKMDAEFLVKAAEINLEEIILGKLAQQKGSSSHVVALGKMMQEQHQRSLNNLTALAKTKMISLPTAITHEGDEAYTKLNKKLGIEFDKTYADMMVSGHQDAIRMFEKASTECQDPDIKAWAMNTLPELRTHLEHSIICQKECAKMTI